MKRRFRFFFHHEMRPNIYSFVYRLFVWHICCSSAVLHYFQLYSPVNITHPQIIAWLCSGFSVSLLCFRMHKWLLRYMLVRNLNTNAVVAVSTHTWPLQRFLFEVCTNKIVHKQALDCLALVHVWDYFKRMFYVSFTFMYVTIVFQYRLRHNGIKIDTIFYANFELLHHCFSPWCRIVWNQILEL